MNTIDLIKKYDKIPSELLNFTYGSMILRLINDYDNPEEINERLFNMGKRIGNRLIDDYLAKVDTKRQCQNFRNILDNLSSKGFKLYLGVECIVVEVNEKEFNLVFSENPLNDYVQLPSNFVNLWYSNLIPGLIVGGMEMLNIKAECFFIKDMIKGNDCNEVKVKLIEIIEERCKDDDE